MSRPRLAVTLGDPRGIGPEVVAHALRSADVRACCDLVVVGAEGCGVAVDEPVGRWTADGSEAQAGRLAGAAIERAAALALGGAVQGIVTAPLDKHALLAGGYGAPGHTEMLAALTGARVAMMLAEVRDAMPPEVRDAMPPAASGSAPEAPPGAARRAAPSAAPDPPSGRHALRVVLATTHLPLRDVPRALTGEAIRDVAAITRAGLRDWYGIPQPRIALCALNPHAGDHGRFGSEDDTLLTPAARAAGLAGPLPADTVFVRALRGAFDAVIAPYHDIGMTAIKVAAFGRAVNVTLGLPFPRTSPDHGTALDIAGRGLADPASFLLATLECARIAGRIAAGRG